MAQNDDLSLGTGLIRKGEARGISPALAVPPRQQEPVTATPATSSPAPTPVAAELPPVAPPAQPAPVVPPLAEEPEPPLRAIPPDDVAKRFTSFRLPVSLDEDLRAMMFETRRSKQDLLIDFVTAGVQAWRRDRVRRG
jgi:hypothetical protein